MTPWKLTLEVARWEFLRFYKIKDTIVTLICFVVLGGFGYWGTRALLTRKPKAVNIAVLNQDRLPFEFPSGSRFKLAPSDTSEPELRAAVGDREIDGLLILKSGDEAELLVAKNPSWLAELSGILSSARREARLRASDLTPEELESLVAPVDVQVEYHEAGDRPSSSAERNFAFVFVILMLIAVFTGNAYLFTGITGEKQLRVTEQVISAISPQTWIDGKILGLSGLAAVSLLTMGVGTILTLLVSMLLGSSFGLPLHLISPHRVVEFLVLAVFGFFLWFSFFAAIAATINDPNTSSRSIFLFVPAIPLALAFFIISDPDSLLARILGLLPLTSPTVLPTRMALTNVPAWEYFVALILLVACIWLLRRAAGKIFEIGILMYGKEPTFREMWRCVRSSKPKTQIDLPR